LKVAFRCGLSIQDYEYMTPYELMLAVEEYQDRMRIEHEARIVQAYMTAAWQRAKRMPSLKKVLRDVQPKQMKQQSPEEMLAVIIQIHKAMERGGDRNRSRA
jgi:lipase chaperone LimK